MESNRLSYTNGELFTVDGDHDTVVNTLLELDEVGPLRNESLIVGNKLVPTVFLIGAQKCGTTSLFSAIARSAQVIRGSNKEFFMFNHAPEETKYGTLKGYLNRFPSLPVRKNAALDRFVSIDGSTGYLFNPTSAKRLYDSFPQPVRDQFRILITLRDPVERLYSWYGHALKQQYSSYTWVGTEGYRDFSIAVESMLSEAEVCESQGLDVWLDTACRERCIGLTVGFYARQIERWLEYFPPEQILIVGFTDVIEGGPQLASSLSSFLGVDLSHMEIPNKMVGDSSREEMRNETRQVLMEYYEPHRVALVDLLTRLGYSRLPPFIDL